MSAWWWWWWWSCTLNAKVACYKNCCAFSCLVMFLSIKLICFAVAYTSVLLRTEKCGIDVYRQVWYWSVVLMCTVQAGVVMMCTGRCGIEVWYWCVQAGAGVVLMWTGRCGIEVWYWCEQAGVILMCTGRCDIDVYRQVWYWCVQAGVVMMCSTGRCGIDVYRQVWYWEPSVLTGICLLGILVSVVDFAVPTLNSYLFSSSEWCVLLAVSVLWKSSCHSLLQKQLKILWSATGSVVRWQIIFL